VQAERDAMLRSVLSHSSIGIVNVSLDVLMILVVSLRKQEVCERPHAKDDQGSNGESYDWILR
jgi:hypothetical protein